MNKEAVEVSVNFNELQDRVNTLRGDLTNVLHKTKEKLEAAAKTAGLPVTIIVTASMRFGENDTDKKK